MNNQIALSSLSMDLKRVSVGLQRGSVVMAKRFAKEALRRQKEIDMNQVHPYIAKLLEQMVKKIINWETDKLAEDSLMYSTLFQNYLQQVKSRNQSSS